MRGGISNGGLSPSALASNEPSRVSVELLPWLDNSFDSKDSKCSSQTFYGIC